MSQSRRFRAASAGGFTLIELLVVIAIIALLVSILMPSLQQAKVLAGVAACQNQMHALGIGILQYTNECNDFLPYVDGAGNLDTFETFANGKPIGFGRLYQLKLIENHRMFFCPGAKVLPAYGVDDEQSHRRNRDEYPNLFNYMIANGGWNLRVDYVLGWWTEWTNADPGTPPSAYAFPPRWRRDAEKQTLTSYTYSKSSNGNPNVNYQVLSADSWDWIFPVEYHLTSHGGGKFQNILKTDGSVKVNPETYNNPGLLKTVVTDWEAAGGYELYANQRPPYAWWIYYGSGRHIR